MWRGVALLLLLAAASCRAGQLYAGLHEGDIAVRRSSSLASHAFIDDKTRIWDYGKVPYLIDPNIADEDHRLLIHEVIDDIHAMATCITFEDISESETKPNSYLK